MIQSAMTDTNRAFNPPPEAPVFEPTEEEFRDPLAYINKIRPVAQKAGICKVRPPAHWQPPFAVDVENFRFVPRVQRLNELEACSRVKLIFLDKLAKFWNLQGTRVRIPNVERKALDLYSLHKIVNEEGGFEKVCRDRRWTKVCNRLNYPPGKGVSSTIRSHYEKILYPFDIFQMGASVDPSKLEPVKKSDEPPQTPRKRGERQSPRKSGSNPPSTTSDNDSRSSLLDEYPTTNVKTEEIPTVKTEVDSDLTEKSEKLLKLEAGYYVQTTKRRSKRLSKENPSADVTMNNELRKLQFYGPGPKAALPAEESMEEPVVSGENSTSIEKKELGAGTTTPKKNLRDRSHMHISYVDQYLCHSCGRGDGEDLMLLCDGCDDAFHIYCLIPPMVEVPKGDWRCPKCVALECSKPLDAYGFEQSRVEYSLQQFGEKADQFKMNYFGKPVHMVGYSEAEREFWRLVNSLEEDVLVEYGADIHAIDSGSGFPTKETQHNFEEDVSEYIDSGWNLNNLPVEEKSILHHINANISGMKVPWCYVGMCFASFCWHNEDHWSYSISYNHWGEPKTWYGVPGDCAVQFEEAMKKTAPELFENAPDLLHHITTIMNPNIIMDYGVPVVRTDQCAGEFVVTFPRAYHAGFNQGYNFAEAVNFCPADWLPIGRSCIDHYSELHRQCVFSHEELICKMAADPDSLDLNLAAVTHADMLAMVDSERKLRKSLLDRGTTDAEREAFELLPDDERQCDVCKTTCFLSAVTCSCSTRLVCIKHVEELCSCSPSNHCLRYRYTLDELPAMLHRLKIRAESYDNWAAKVKFALEATGNQKLELQGLKDLIHESKEKKFPDNEILSNLQLAISEAEKCAGVASQLVSRKVRTRNRQSGDSKYISKLTLEELELFLEQVENLPCQIKEAASLKELLQKVVDFQAEAQEALEEEVPDSEKLDKLVDFGATLDVDLPEIPRLKEVLEQAKWLDDVRNTLSEPETVTLEAMRKFLDSGVSLAPHPAVEKTMAELQELLTISERWEERARICLQARPRHVIGTLEAIINEAKGIPAYLPNVEALKDAMRKAKEWTSKVEAVQNGEHYPYLDVLENLVNKGRPIPVRLDALPQVESQVAAAKSWRERTARTFLKKNSTYTLVEIIQAKWLFDDSSMLSPRGEIGCHGSKHVRRRKMKDERREFTEDGTPIDMKVEEHRDPAAMVAAFKYAEQVEVDAMRELRARNMEKLSQAEEGDVKFCVCGKGASGFMLQCELCKDWFHSTCVPLPKSANLKSKLTHAATIHAIRDLKFLCPLCLRSRRPRLETILSLLVSLQKLPVRLPEGEALQCLTERAMAWQDRARQALATDELASALAKLSVLSQKIVEQAAREKTEKIINAELLKAANNPDLQGHLHSVQQSAFSGLQVPGISAPQSASVMLEDEETENMPLEEVLPSIDDVQHEVEIQPVSTNMSSEHAYSSASKPNNSSPRKHQRKTPLVPRQMETPVLELSDMAKAQLEELMMEGDLLEVSLDETQHIWRILQACYSRPEDKFMEFDDVDPELLERTEKERKKKKRKKEMLLEEGLIGIGGKKIKVEKDILKKKKKFGKDGKEKKILTKKEKEKKREEKLKKKKRKELKEKKDRKPRMKDVKKEKDDEDDCSAAPCLKPTGEEVNWVQCDRCEMWFHLLCVGLSETDISENEDYICFNCGLREATGLPVITIKREKSTDASSDKQNNSNVDIIPFDDIKQEPVDTYELQKIPSPDESSNVDVESMDTDDKSSQDESVVVNVSKEDASSIFDEKSCEGVIAGSVEMPESVEQKLESDAVVDEPVKNNAMESSDANLVEDDDLKKEEQLESNSETDDQVVETPVIDSTDIPLDS